MLVLWPWSVNVGPWPWSLINIVSVAVLASAAITAWRSAELVVPKNRAWTRAWRLLLTGGVSFSFGGILLPVGAVYVLARRPWSSRSSALRSAAV